MYGEHRKVMIDRATGSAAIECESQLADAPRNLGWLPIVPRLDSCFDEGGFEMFGVLQDSLPFSISNGFAEECVRAIADHGTTVSVRGANCETFAGKIETV